MSSQHRKLRLEEVLADSMTKAVMEADGVDLRELETELRRTAALLQATPRTLIPLTSTRSDLRGKRDIA